MSVIISADYYGSAIKSARDRNHISALKMARLLGVDVSTLHKYESGNDLIPRHVLRRVFILAATMNAITENE